MTLLELLRRELPKRGGWPEGANFIAQDDGGDVWGFVNALGKDEDDEWVEILRTGTHKLLGHLLQVSDHATAIVTREQYEAARWDGTGLPPVGMEIEYKFAKANYRTDFSRGKVLAYGIHNVFMEHWSSKNEFIQPLDKLEFRPLRTEAERTIDEMVRLSGVSIGAAKILYDAGYRKG